ncbi:MAG: hypothetical protein Q7T50_05145 [Candidatus Magasanikbacteria bacterium]|nr:hypothetical protein [Candidatus Magasanikbacteria bacterium]
MKSEKQNKPKEAPPEEKETSTNTYNPLTIFLGTAKHIRLPDHIVEKALKEQKS